MTNRQRRSIRLNGAAVAYPEPSTAFATKIMRANPSRNTAPERKLRSLLHRSGRRYRVHLPIRVDQGRPIRADIAFTRIHFVVFIDGCFWHACPTHGSFPKANRTYWRPKLLENAKRDHRTNSRLRKAGWRVLRLWEHDDPVRMLGLIEKEINCIDPPKGGQW